MKNAKLKVYVAGPMRGCYYYNWAKFDIMKRCWLGQLRGEEVHGLNLIDWSNGDYAVFAPRQVEVLTPHDLDLRAGFDVLSLPDDTDWSNYPVGFDLGDCYQRCFDAVKWCDCVFMLDGWRESRGARAEHALAVWMGKNIIESDQDFSEWPMLFHTDMARRKHPRAESERSLKDHDLGSQAVTPVDPGLEARSHLDYGGGEVRMVDAVTGGVKGEKLCRFDLLPWDALWEVAELYGVGARKYEVRNWERGYRWSLSFQAMMRHVTQFWQFGVRTDAELGKHHLAAAAFHCLAMLAFDLRGDGTDDRPLVANGEKKSECACEKTA